MTIGYTASTDQTVVIGQGAVCTSAGAVAIGVGATANGYRTPVQRLYIDILKYKYKVVKCRRKKNVIEIRTSVSMTTKLDYDQYYKLEPKDDVG